MASDTASRSTPPEDAQPEPATATDQDAPVEASTAPRSRQSRRRTKTGCLTCRKRRIKCGEERPICNNCIKSKRHCEGYNQRVIFKTPNTDFRIPGSNTIPYHTGSLPGAQRNFQHQILPSAQQTYPLTPLLPRDADQPDIGLVGGPVSAAADPTASLGTFIPYANPQGETVLQDSAYPAQYPQYAETNVSHVDPTQFIEQGHPPPTPQSARVHGIPTLYKLDIDFNRPEEYPASIGFAGHTPISTTQATPHGHDVTPTVPEPMPQAFFADPRLVRPEWQSNIFDGQVTQPQHSEHPHVEQWHQIPSSHPDSQIPMPVTPSQGTDEFHTMFAKRCAGFTRGLGFPDRVDFEPAYA
jgi:hypothetical protein